MAERPLRAHAGRQEGGAEGVSRGHDKRFGVAAKPSLTVRYIQTKMA